MNEPRLRKRKNYFEVEHAQRERDIKLIKRESSKLNAFCRSIGLKIDKILLNRDDLELDEHALEKSIKVLVQKETLSKEEIALKFLQAKDTANMSNRKYRNFKKAIVKIGK